MPRVLVISADPSRRRVVSESIGSAGYETEFALTASQLKSCLDGERRCDAIVVGRSVPVMEKERIDSLLALYPSHPPIIEAFLRAPVMTRAVRAVQLDEAGLAIVPVLDEILGKK